MNITLFDNTLFKFSRVLIEHWRQQGHTVVTDKLFDPKICVDADVIFFDWVDQSLQRASHADDEIWKQIGVQLQGKRVIVRCHDIDAWTGNPATVNWHWVNDLIFVADHIKRHVDSYMHFSESYPQLKIHLIKHGIDTEKYTFRSILNRKIAWFGPFNDKKCFELALLVLAKLPGWHSDAYKPEERGDYELHAVGKELRNWRRAYVMDFIKRHKLHVTFYDEVSDVNQFLEDKSILLTSGFKEAFGYIIGEAASKGLLPVVHHFYGADEVWPQEWLWDFPEQAVDKILYHKYEPEKYRQYIIDHYPERMMLQSYDDLICKK